MDIKLTDSAATRIKTLCTENKSAMVRLSVDGGGCSGFQYIWGFAKAANLEDTVFEHQGAKLVIDGVSLPLIEGSVIDYVDALSGAHFKIENPKATSSCGCGTSFSL
ncbi:MAG: iron-sulfur cluster assembly accessory protein [Alphaproteobacteria bacterium]|nr:iron-sulfur cluster assembly accessory protein [Alphaproteobacteria bacterium]